MKLEQIAKEILEVHHSCAREAGKSVNKALTLRNWLIGFYIKQYEQKGADRATYGTNLLNKLADELKKKKVPSTSFTSLKQYRLFYEMYPQIGQTLSGQFKSLKMGLKIQALPGQFEIETSTENQLPSLPIEEILSNLSFSHFVELIKVEEPLKRSFYEIETIRGNWGVRELSRQIGSLYYERLGLSKNKEKVASLIGKGDFFGDIKEVIRDPYLFEFVGIKKEEVTESNLATALCNDLNQFFLEMGRGFCFEAREKKILIGDQYFFIDLVLYNRIHKFSLLIELKIGKLTHEHIGQLNTYVNYYKENELYSGDHPPVGLLLCTEKNETLVKYALGSIDNNLFVSKYKLELPSSEEIKTFLEKKLKTRDEN